MWKNEGGNNNKVDRCSWFGRDARGFILGGGGYERKASLNQANACSSATAGLLDLGWVWDTYADE